MKYSSVESEYLIQLIKCAVKSEPVPCPPDDIDWAGLIELSKSQQVYSIIAVLLDGSILPEEQAAELKNYSQSELLRIIAMKNELELIENDLKENQIKYILLKGSVLRNYYPQQKMRQMSDIDILYDSDCRDRLFEIMKRHNYVCRNAADNSDDFVKKPFYTFEFHRELFFEEADFCPKFDYVWDNAVQDDKKEYLYHMSLEDMYVYNICHMYKHFRKGCCGIRFLTDNYLFLKKESDNLNWAYIEDCLKKFNILDYEQKARVLAMKLFDGEALSEQEAKRLYLYTNFGIYGSSEGRAVLEYAETAEDGEKSYSRLRFFIKRIFPDRKVMEYNYPYLKKRPYLILLAYISRFFKGIFKRDKIESEIKSINELRK